jgi:chitodextrinase
LSVAAAKRMPLVWFTVFALAAFALVGGSAAAPSDKDHSAPTTPKNLRVTTATTSTVTLAWDPTQDDTAVVGYYVYGDRGKATVDRNLDKPQYTVNGLSCGQSVQLGVVAFDDSQNRSEKATTTVSASPCLDTQPPSSPSGFTQAATSQTAVVLTWTPSYDNVGVVGYAVYRNLQRVASPADPAATLATLSCGSSYQYTVDAVDAAGNRSPLAMTYVSTASCSTSSPPPPTTDTQAPTTPTGLAASNVAQTALTLSWNASSDNVGVAGYDVYRDGTKVASPTSTNAGLSGLACATSYAFAVQARDAAGNVSSQAKLNVSTASCSTSSPPPPTTDTQAPSAPGGLEVLSATANSVLLRWDASSDNVGLQGYRLYSDHTLVTSTAETFATASGLVCGHAYTFEVEAFDAAGNTSPRTSLVGATLACPDSQAPSAPADIVASSRTATSIALTWSASTDNVGVTGYGLYRGGTQVGTSSGTTWIFSGLTCNTNYTLAVDAYDAAGNRSAKVSLMVSTTACPDTTPPTAPSGLAASNVTGTSLMLTWNAASDNTGVTGYDIYQGGTKIANVSSTSSAQSGLACGTSYTFGVVARDAAGNSSAMTSLSVSTASCPAPTWTSSIADGATVQSGTNWTATVSPSPDSVEFWATPSGGTPNKLETDTSAPYDVVLNLTPGNYLLGVCAWYGSARTCFNDRKNITIILTSTSSSSSSSTSSPYFVADYQNGSFGSPLTTLFSYASPGFVDLTQAGATTGTSDGRVKVVPSPSGSGNAARFEMRDSDPGWPNNTALQKSVARTVPQYTFNKSGVSVGDVRWFSTRLYLPYTASEKFEWAHGGSNAFTDLVDLHPDSGTAWPAFSVQWYPSSGAQWAKIRVAGGPTINSTQYLEEINLWQLTDASGARVMSNYNRWIDLTWGMRFAPDSTGWLEVWVDGVNVYPRKNRPTMWAGDFGEFLQQGLYKQKDASFPETGRSVIYYGPTTIGLAKP